MRAAYGQPFFRQRAGGKHAPRGDANFRFVCRGGEAVGAGRTRRPDLASCRRGVADRREVSRLAVVSRLICELYGFVKSSLQRYGCSVGSDSARAPFGLLVCVSRQFVRCCYSLGYRDMRRSGGCGETSTVSGSSFGWTG